MNKIHDVYTYLRVADTKAAIEFYGKVFGATEKFRLVEPGTGRIGHAEIDLGDSVVMLSDAFPEYGMNAPTQDSETFVTIHLHVDNADEMIELARQHGAKVEREPQDEFYGERGGAIICPFGHRWLIGHSIEDVAPEEMQRRYDAMFQ
jgi:uncharacterized glyoxalase superfamily protein PhnB